MEVVLTHDAVGGNRTIEARQRLSVLIVEITEGVGVPLPVSEGEHGVEFKPTYGLNFCGNLDAHVACVYTCHGEVIVIRTVFGCGGVNLVAFRHGLVHPFGIIGIDVHSKYR